MVQKPFNKLISDMLELRVQCIREEMELWRELLDSVKGIESPSELPPSTPGHE
jgi:hypothetical protein